MNINHIIFKTTSICNLSCEYCYVFNKQDRSYQYQDDLMSLDVVNVFMTRLEEYLSVNKNLNVYITFHGGEPLLQNKSFYIEFANKLQNFPNQVKLNIQTNGTLIDEEWCNIFKKYNISVGISIDGNEKANSYRKFKNGLCAYSQILRGYDLLVKHNVPFGVLSVINTKVSPLDYYTYFKNIKAQYVDCLLPDANYQTYNSSNRGMGIWLCQLFDIWYSDKERFSIRFFESIMKLILRPNWAVGGEMFGNTTNGVIDISPNGDIDVPDTLRICNTDLKKGKYSIYRNKLIDICEEDIFQKFYYSHTDRYISGKCKKCIIREICGGGILAHRFSHENKFDNPSVYCYDLFLIIMHIQRVLCLDLKDGVIDEININDFNAW